MYFYSLKVFYEVVPRHQARIVKLTYQGEGPVEETLMFVGKVRFTIIII